MRLYERRWLVTEMFIASHREGVAAGILEENARQRDKANRCASSMIYEDDRG